MRIEFWVDYLCPITYLTHQNLLAALAELGLEENEIYYRSFRLSERVFEASKQNENIMNIVYDHFPLEREFNHFDTDKAHQVAHLAKWHELGKEYNTALLRKRFDQQADITKDETILEVAKEINLNLDEVQRVLDSCCYTTQINNNKENATRRGIDLIPHIRINMKHNLNGFHTKETLVNEINNIINKKPVTKTECGGEVCEY